MYICTPDDKIAEHHASGPADAAPEWDCGLPTPVGALAVALLGFATACCWINAFATELLGLLQFFGVLWGISDMVRGSIRGLAETKRSATYLVSA